MSFEPLAERARCKIQDTKIKGQGARCMRQDTRRKINRGVQGVDSALARTIHGFPTALLWLWYVCSVEEIAP
jgi:hypothetical protein